MGNIAFSIHFQNVNRGKWWKTQIRIFHDSASIDFSNISDSCEGLCDKRKIVKSPKRGISKTELLIVIALCYSFWDMINWQGKLHKVERDGSSVNSSDYEMGKNICCMPKHWLGYRTKQMFFTVFHSLVTIIFIYLQRTFYIEIWGLCVAKFSSSLSVSLFVIKTHTSVRNCIFLHVNGSTDCIKVGDDVTHQLLTQRVISIKKMFGSFVKTL